MVYILYYQSRMAGLISHSSGLSDETLNQGTHSLTHSHIQFKVFVYIFLSSGVQNMQAAFLNRPISNVLNNSVYRLSLI